VGGGGGWGGRAGVRRRAVAGPCLELQNRKGKGLQEKKGEVKSIQRPDWGRVSRELKDRVKGESNTGSVMSYVPGEAVTEKNRGERKRYRDAKSRALKNLIWGGGGGRKRTLRRKRAVKKRRCTKGLG